ncbi:unnamed protein product [Brugia pahangi]|uniref:G_PROTEIN_RECEP_F1_2 domain-containing protein n=1 Tax=Brugia pahangi TaxID=6280 RepID=A0A0N4TY19_BRUPA|nr:unnamed protein product [Brugia pahangi]
MAHFYCIIILLLVLSSTCQERNTTSEANIRDENYKSTKYIAFLLVIVLLVYGFIINTLMAIVFHRRQDNHYSREFILIATQIIICNFIALFIQVIVVLPEILRTKNNLFVNQTVWINYTFSSFNNFSLFAILNFSFLLTVNRFVVLVLPKYNVFFESTRLYFLIILVWLLTLVLSAIDSHFCIKSFHISNLCWIRNCRKRLNSVFMGVHYIWSSFSPIAMFIMYIVMFYNIRCKRQLASKIHYNQDDLVISMKRKLNMARNNIHERSMLIQAALTCGIFEMNFIFFYLLPPFIIKIFDERAHIPLRIFINCYIIFIYAALPTVYFLCNNRALKTLTFERSIRGVKRSAFQRSTCQKKV